MAKKKPASKNPPATAGVTKTKVLLGAGEPDSNLPFSLWTAGSWTSSVGVGSNHTDFQYAVDTPRGLKRGRLREASPNLRGGATTPFRLYFMFNPATIQHTYSFDPAATPAAFETVENLSVPNMTQGAAIGFELLFDRVYEVWKGQPAIISGRRGPGQIGTLWDVQALDRLLGVFHDQNTGRPLGPAIGYPIVASFGAEQGRSIEFYGYINAVQIEHTMFDVNMTPTRTSIGISMTQTYLPTTGATTGSFDASGGGNFPSSGGGGSAKTNI